MHSSLAPHSFSPVPQADFQLSRTFWHHCCVHSEGTVALQLELARLREENAAVTQQLKGYEADVANLVALGTVGHANPKQKLQYNSQCAPPLSTPLH